MLEIMNIVDSADNNPMDKSSFGGLWIYLGKGYTPKLLGFQLQPSKRQRLENKMEIF